MTDTPLILDGAQREACERNINILNNGAIEWQSILTRTIPWQSIDHLLSFIEDNSEGEEINWHAVWSDVDAWNARIEKRKYFAGE